MSAFEIKLLRDGEEVALESLTGAELLHLHGWIRKVESYSYKRYGEFDLPTRLVNTLKEYGISTDAELLDACKYAVPDLPNVGKAGKAEIKAYVAKLREAGK